MVTSAEARAYKEHCGWLLKAAGITEPTSGEVRLRVCLYRPAKRGDLDNFLKILIDSLNGILYVDDAQVVEIHALRFEDKNNPRVEITEL